MLNLNPVLLLPFEPDSFAVGKYEVILDKEFKSVEMNSILII